MTELPARLDAPSLPSAASSTPAALPCTDTRATFDAEQPGSFRQHAIRNVHVPGVGSKSHDGSLSWQRNTAGGPPCRPTTNVAPRQSTFRGPPPSMHAPPLAAQLGWQSCGASGVLEHMWFASQVSIVHGLP